MTRTTARRRARGGARPDRSGGAVTQSPWTQVRYRTAPTNVLSADQVEAIHEAALLALQELGLKILLPEARATGLRATA